MKTLDEHNRERAAAIEAAAAQAAGVKKAGVHCPQCFDAGDRIEMDKDSVIRTANHTAQSVICPECGHSGVML